MEKSHPLIHPILKVDGVGSVEIRRWAIGQMSAKVLDFHDETSSCERQKHVHTFSTQASPPLEQTRVLKSN